MRVDVEKTRIARDAVCMLVMTVLCPDTLNAPIDVVMLTVELIKSGAIVTFGHMIGAICMKWMRGTTTSGFGSVSGAVIPRDLHIGRGPTDPGGWYADSKNVYPEKSNDAVIALLISWFNDPVSAHTTHTFELVTHCVPMIEASDPLSSVISAMNASTLRIRPV
jgi:hypothetical protein